MRAFAGRGSVLSYLVGLSFVVGASVRASGDAFQVYLHDDTSHYSYSDGGEFQAYNFGSGFASVLGTQAANVGSVDHTIGGTTYSPTMQVFCVEVSEEFVPDQKYYASFSTNAMWNGAHTGVGVSLTTSVAYLFTQFSAGTLSGYNYDPNAAGDPRSTSAGELQYAIWALMGETPAFSLSGSALTQANSWISDANANAASWSAGQVTAGNGVYGDVRIMNMWTDPTVHSYATAAQDQLIMVPNGSPLQSAPLPKSLAGGLVLLGAMLCGRQIKRRQHAA
jgi:hypothetical protein